MGGGGRGENPFGGGRGRDTAFPDWSSAQGMEGGREPDPGKEVLALGVQGGGGTVETKIKKTE